MQNINREIAVLDNHYGTERQKIKHKYEEMEYAEIGRPNAGKSTR